MTSTGSLLEAIKVVDTDTHIIEPADLWTSRVSVQKWGELVPHVKWDPRAEEEAWFFGDARLAGVGQFLLAGWHEFPPGRPRRWEDMDPAGWDPAKRLERMTEM